MKAIKKYAEQVYSIPKRHKGFILVKKDKIDRWKKNPGKQNFKSALTDFVNDYYMRYPANEIRVLDLVFTKMNKMLDNFSKATKIKRDNFVFILKGGNQIRFIANRFIYLLPYDVRRDLTAMYADVVKRADNDFTILINPNIKRVEYITNLLSSEVYRVLSEIVDFLTKYDNNHDYFTWERFRPKVQRDAIKKTVEILNKRKELVDIYGEKIPYIRTLTTERGVDAFINYDKEGNIVRYPFKKRRGNLYATLNVALFFELETPGDFKRFNLARIKMNFIANSKYTGNGELIDVALPHHDDAVQKKIKKIGFKKYIKKYVSKKSFPLDEKDLHAIDLKMDEFYGRPIKFNYNVFNIDYVLKDTLMMLTGFNQYPWDNKKYKKRVKRMILFTFMRDLEDMTITPKSLITLKKIYSEFLSNVSKGKTPNTQREPMKAIYGLVRRTPKNLQGKLSMFIKVLEHDIKEIMQIVDRYIEYFTSSKITDVVYQL